MEDKFIACIHDVEIVIVLDNQYVVNRKKTIKLLFKRAFTSRKLLQKYKTANITLDIINLICHAATEKNRYTEIARVLSTAFARSCAIFGISCTVISFNDENVDFFFDKNEQAVAEWCRKNNKQAGRATDTLRQANAIYFPVKTGRRTYAIAFSCLQSKMTVTEKLVFSQLLNILQLAL